MPNTFRHSSSPVIPRIRDYIVSPLSLSALLPYFHRNLPPSPPTPQYLSLSRPLSRPLSRSSVPSSLSSQRMATSASDEREEQLLLAHHAAASQALRYSAVHPVYLDGWLAKEGKALRSRRSRYIRLNTHILSSHRTKSAPPSWQISIADAIIEKGSHPREIKISLPHRSLSLVAPTPSAFDTWIVALRRASVVSSRVDDYYNIGRLIGEGMNGQVRVAQDMLTDEAVAVKMVPRLGRENETQFLAREVQIILSVTHPNIVSTVDVFVTRRRIHFVMEYLAGGELFDFIAENTHFTEMHAATVMVDLLNALSYLHSRGIAHRDVKLENLLCANSTWPLNVKLADFGFANYVNSANEPMLSSFVGTPYYIAPEMLRADPHGRPVDIWASGVVLYILLSGKFPFGGKNESEYYQRVLCKEAYFPSEEWATVSEDAKNLVRGMLCKDPRKRFTADQCLHHAWLKRATGMRDPMLNEMFPRDVPTPRSDALLTSPNVFRSNRAKRGRWRQLGMLNHSLNQPTDSMVQAREQKQARKESRTEYSSRNSAFSNNDTTRVPGEDATINRRPSLIRRLLSSGKLSLDRYDGRFPSFRGSVEEADEASATPRKTLSLFAKDGPLRRSFHRVGERVVESRTGGVGGSGLDNGIHFVNSQSQRLPPKIARERQRHQRQQAEANRKTSRGVGTGIFSSYRKSGGGTGGGGAGGGGGGSSGGYIGNGHYGKEGSIYHSSPRLHTPVAQYFQSSSVVPYVQRGHSSTGGRKHRTKGPVAAATMYENHSRLQFSSGMSNTRRETESSLEDNVVRRTRSADVAARLEQLEQAVNAELDEAARHDPGRRGMGRQDHGDPDDVGVVVSVPPPPPTRDAFDVGLGFSRLRRQ